MNLYSTLLYLTIIMYCITSCQISKANDTNLGLELTVSPWRTNLPITITNLITRNAVQRCLLILTLFYLFVSCFIYTFVSYFSMRCVIVPLDHWWRRPVDKPAALQQTTSEQTTSVQHECLKDKMKDYQILFCAVLCTSSVHSDMHTHMSSYYRLVHVWARWFRFMFNFFCIRP